MPIQSIVDPITFEVLRNKLQAIVNEQTIALRHVSGSPVVTEAADFNTGICLPDGTPVMRGQGIIMHASSVAQITRSVIQDCTSNPGIREGDIFYVNDPWKGSLHQSDMGLVAPFFYQGELVAWSGVVLHEIDVGGMVHGSWCPEATEKFQEGVAFPPIKIAEGGNVRHDITSAILSQSRLPLLMALDLKAMIASINIARKRLVELIERYGCEVIKAVLQGLVDRAELAMRKRLRQLPDGTFRGIDFLDHDGHQNKLYKVGVTVIKKGDAITFDFSDTSAQAPGYINCTEVAMHGGVAQIVFLTLAYDLPWNGGILRPIKVIGPKGILCNAEMPSPVSGGTVSASRVLINACTQALSRLLYCSDKFRLEARGVTAGTFMTLNLRGISQHGEGYGTMLMDAMASGEAGYEFRDGVHGHGHSGAPRTQIPNVENNENFAPIMYLYRRIMPDTGGPGKFRGGNTLGVAFGIHTDRPQEAVLCGHGVESPNSQGVAGGLPGSCAVNTLRKETDFKLNLRQGRLIDRPAELQGKKLDLGAKPGRVTFDPDDVFEYSWQGGGGWGDPLEREPRSVQQDVANGYLSPAYARQAFGVVLDKRTLELRPGESAARRRRMQARRMKSGTLPKPEVVQVAGPAKHLAWIGPDLELAVFKEGKVIRCKCAYQFGPADRNWKDGALCHIRDRRALGPCRKLHRDLEMRQYICPRCGVLHSVEINLKGAPPLSEIELK